VASPTVISLYTGAGGLDLGLEAAGFEVGAAVEWDGKACETLRANRRWPLFEGDIHTLSSERICEMSGLSPEEPDLLIGGPPCQPFSKSAYWRSGDTKRLGDPRADTLSAYLRVLRDLRPKAFLLENVQGLAFNGKDEGLRLLRDTIRAVNLEVGTEYSFTVAKLNAADFGVPQTRERVLIVGSRDGKELHFPTASHRDPLVEPSADSPAREPWLTAWDAIGDLQDDDDPTLAMGGKWGALLPSVPEGENYLWHTDRGGGKPLFGWRRRYWGFLLKLAKRRPAWTIQAQPGPAIGPFHWKSRKLSVRELCRLQTFPDSYEIVGSRLDAQRQLGNAVPSLLGERIGRAIRSQFFGHAYRTASPRLAVRRRGEIPAPEPVRRVPKRYEAQIGTHAAHPGTGLGYGAAARVAANAESEG
jgi:DNA (cytosine-5)-methyltransferase 1